MLLKYSIENYKSIKNKETIDFNASSLTQHKNHLINNSILPVIALYGPNGGGKTAILESINIFKSLIFPEFNNIFSNSQYLKKQKNNKDKLMKFEISFKDDNERILNYGIHFGDKIDFEEFKIENKTIFKKEKEKYEFCAELQKTDFNFSNFNSAGSLLFVFSNFFKNPEIQSLAKEFKKIQWIDNTFALNKSKGLFGEPVFSIGNIALLMKYKKKVIKIFNDLDINIHDIDMIESPVKDGSFNVILHKKDMYDEIYKINYNDESNGTQKIIILLSFFLETIHNKSLIIVDELDAGIHTKILKYLILMFMKNNKGAQLIFSSHDMPTLDSSIFRKDEIYFAAINDSKFTSIVSLREFGSDVREANNFSKLYLDGKLGYDPYIDYSLKAFEENE